MNLKGRTSLVTSTKGTVVMLRTFPPGLWFGVATARRARADHGARKDTAGATGKRT